MLIDCRHCTGGATASDAATVTVPEPTSPTDTTQCSIVMADRDHALAVLYGTRRSLPTVRYPPSKEGYRAQALLGYEIVPVAWRRRISHAAEWAWAKDGGLLHVSWRG